MSLNNQKQILKKTNIFYFLACLYGQAHAPIMDNDSKLWIKYFLNNTGFKNKLMFFYLAKLLCTWPCGQISLAVQEFVIKKKQKKHAIRIKYNLVWVAVDYRNRSYSFFLAMIKLWNTCKQSKANMNDKCLWEEISDTYTFLPLFHFFVLTFTFLPNFHFSLSQVEPGSGFSPRLGWSPQISPSSPPRLLHPLLSTDI